MKSKEMNVKVENVSDGKDKFVVARLVEGKLWYYGRYETENRAKEVSEEFENGLVLFDETAKEPKPEIKCSRCGKVLTDFDMFMDFCPICMKKLEKKE